MKVIKTMRKTDSFRLMIKIYEPETEVKSFIVGVHDFDGSMHSLTLENLAKVMTEHGYAVITFTFPGPGTSGVEITSKGKPLIHMNPHIDTSYLAQISKDFELLTEPSVRYDHSTHYMCYLDENWSADQRRLTWNSNNILEHASNSNRTSRVTASGEVTVSSSAHSAGICDRYYRSRTRHCAFSFKL